MSSVVTNSRNIVKSYHVLEATNQLLETTGTTYTKRIQMRWKGLHIYCPLPGLPSRVWRCMPTSHSNRPSIFEQRDPMSTYLSIPANIVYECGSRLVKIRSLPRKLMASLPISKNWMVLGGADRFTLAPWSALLRQSSASFGHSHLMMSPSKRTKRTCK